MKKTGKHLIFLLTVLLISFSSVAVRADESSDITPVMEWETDHSLLCGAGCQIYQLPTPASVEDFLGYDPASVPRLFNAGGTIPQGASRQYYSRMNDHEKGLYDEIDSAMTAYYNSAAWTSDLNSETCYIDLAYSEPGYSFNSTTVTKVARAYKADNPQYYWLANYLGINVVTGTAYLRYAVDSYYYQKSVRTTADNAISSLSATWITELTSVHAAGGSDADYLTALRLHDLIINRINYKHNSSGQPEDSRWAHSIAGVFTGQGVVCEGYAKTFSYILNRMDIANIYIEGTASGDGHAWNAICINENWYLCDVTWDDPNPSTASDFNETYYNYFCLPVSLFKKDHTPDSATSSLLPAFSDSNALTYFVKFGSYSSAILDDASATALKESAYSNQYKYADYLHFVLTDGDSLPKLAYALGMTGSFTYMGSPMGYLIRVMAVTVNVPATSVSLSQTSVTIDRGGSVTITATLPTGSDDRILWSVDNSTLITIAPAGKTCTIAGKRNATITLKATTYKGEAIATCVIKIGTGVSGSDIIIWQNGTKDYKSGTITPSITATNWKNTRGATQKGKLVWLVLPEKTVIQFDSTKHQVTTKTNNKSACSVNAKGVVTAKSAGKAYVYVCDTGTCTYEEFEIIVLGAPSKLTLTKVAGSDARENAASRVSINIGQTVKLYLLPFLKDNQVDPSNTFTVKFSKSEMGNYASLSDVQRDSNGNWFFTITGLNYDTAKARNVSVKVDVVNVQSGRKASVNATIGNPILSIVTEVKKIGSTTVENQAEANLSEALAARNSTVVLDMQYRTVLGADTNSADTVKYVIGLTSVTLDGKRVTNDRGSAVRATFDKKTNALTLKMSAKECTTAVVYAVITDSLTKEMRLQKICTVAANGTIAIE